jgi:prophage tail gpP-like protein
MNKVSAVINGQEYSNFLSYEFSRDIEGLLKPFSLTLNIPEDRRVIKTGNRVVIKIDGESFLTGFIEDVLETDQQDKSIVTIIGRDSLCDLVDSKLGAKIYKTPVSFVELTKSVLKALNYNVVDKKTRFSREEDISVINNYGDIAILEANDDVAHRDNDSAFEVIKRCADKRRLILNSDGDGNLVINKIGNTVCDTVLLRYRNNNESNVLTSKVHRDDTSRYHKYIVKSIVIGSKQTSNATIDPRESEIITKGREGGSSSIINGTGIYYDDEIRNTRVLTIFKQVSNLKQATELAKWEANIRKTQSFSYDCSVIGFRQNFDDDIEKNPLWQVNTLVDVEDEIKDVFGRFLIKSIRYIKDNNGTRSNLTLVEEKSYTESLFEPIVRNPRGKREENKVIIDGRPEI